MPVIRRLARILRDPLFVFCLLGAGAFLLFDALAPETETLLITPALRAGLEDNFRLLHGRAPDADERAALVQQHLDEEVLFHQALEQGLHLVDARLRRTLIDKMRFLLADLPEEPSEAALLSHYADNLERYYSGQRFSFRNLYFRTLPENASTLLEELRAGRELDGDEGFWLGRDIDRYHAEVVGNVFGDAIRDTLEVMTVGEWAGPLASPRGWHFVRLDAEEPAQPLAFAEVREQVKQDWAMAQRAASIERRLAPLREGYVVREL